MTEETYILAIVALLPLSAGMLVVQTNPYQALVMRGILGSMAALIYALLGAADVALTEALVGTMLSITLYAVAVRSSMRMRLGVLEGDVPLELTQSSTPAVSDRLTEILSALRCALKPHHVRLELVRYPSSQDLEAAMVAQDIHATLVASKPSDPSRDADVPYHLQTRVHHLNRILEPKASDDLIQLTYWEQRDGEDAATAPTAPGG